MEQATTTGSDIAKHVFQVHAADAAGNVLFRKRITCLAVQTRCVVVMEACAGAYYWAREIANIGSCKRARSDIPAEGNSLTVTGPLNRDPPSPSQVAIKRRMNCA
jgi:hypothetical protein